MKFGSNVFNFARPAADQGTSKQPGSCGRLAAIGELASGVAHDINNPLIVVAISSEMMLTQRRGEAKKLLRSRH